MHIHASVTPSVMSVRADQRVIVLCCMLYCDVLLYAALRCIALYCCIAIQWVRDDAFALYCPIKGPSA